ncbi:MAG TPA: FAD-binding protein, partial [Gammaproteobacteria bacterium]|nr:FAD-binding protein [Gammaproteobacteria bacterium]
MDKKGLGRIRVNLGLADFGHKKTASVGGVVSCGSAGCTAGYYGPTAGYVEALRVVDAEGEVRALRRGESGE